MRIIGKLKKRSKCEIFIDQEGTNLLTGSAYRTEGLTELNFSPIIEMSLKFSAGSCRSYVFKDVDSVKEKRFRCNHELLEGIFEGLNDGSVSILQDVRGAYNIYRSKFKLVKAGVLILLKICPARELKSMLPLTAEELISVECLHE